MGHRRSLSDPALNKPVRCHVGQSNRTELLDMASNDLVRHRTGQAHRIDNFWRCWVRPGGLTVSKFYNLFAWPSLLNLLGEYLSAHILLPIDFRSFIQPNLPFTLDQLIHSNFHSKHDMHFHHFSAILATIALSCLSETLCEEAPPNQKPSTCDGVLMVQAEIPEILGVTGKPFNQFVGNLTYSLGMDGKLSLNSTTSSWHCTPINTKTTSTNTMRTLKNVFGSAQMSCNADIQDVESSWVTQWTKVAFSGQLFVSIIVHDGVCASPTSLLGSGTTCNYNAVTDGGLKGNAECRWKTVDQPHHLGDQAEGAGQGGGA
ncbi:hypothetical protein PSHT_00598 [Puccinia striiformis]|uniref:Uncharacterized protein n=1 Tax=Puccinia striiformis TaxID=27350 RepID=A0A2S4WMU9_9BASI|nr:hypothetical protein PSHT_00598 [Puccinia striiformis]